jgi:hypothetical protein
MSIFTLPLDKLGRGLFSIDIFDFSQSYQRRIDKNDGKLDGAAISWNGLKRL